MNTECVRIHEIIKDKLTYPSWTTGTRYPLMSRKCNNKIVVYYYTKQGKKVEREFPTNINLSPNLCYALGFIKGEGPTALGKSNYRRFTITNSDPAILNLVLNELENAKFMSREDIIKNSICIHHHTDPDSEVIRYWSTNLGIPKTKFRCYFDKSRTSPKGVCHIYISDVLLRRIIDLIHDFFPILQYQKLFKPSGIFVSYDNNLRN